MNSIERVVVIGPTRATCEALLALFKKDVLPRTVLEIKCGAELKAATDNLSQSGFGIVAGTGSGKSVAVRRMCEKLFPKGLNVGIITQEYTRNAKTERCNVLVMTPGIAIQHIVDGSLSPARDLIVLDEVHQTSAELEMIIALLRQKGFTVVWVSATIDPTVYQNHFGTKTVIMCTAYAASRRAKVTNHLKLEPRDFLAEHILDYATRKRGVAMFVPTQRAAEELAKEFDGQHGVRVAFYHGGIAAEKLRDFIDGSVPVPFVLVMTPAGASGLTIHGLNTAVIVDRMFHDVIRDGRIVTESSVLDPNMMKQMAGRVDGRALEGEVHILTENISLDLRTLRPVSPTFVLGGALESLAMKTASMGIDARVLSLIGGLDKVAYAKVLNRLVTRGLITLDGMLPRLTSLGKQVEAYPVSAAWGEVIARAVQQHEQVPGQLVAASLAATTGRLYDLTRPQWDKRKDSLVVWGSDHLTAHNIVAAALCEHGYVNDESEGYGFQKGFGEWCETKGYSSKGIRNAAMLFASLVRELKIGLPDPETLMTVKVDDGMYMCFLNLIGWVQSMDFVVDGKCNGISARPDKRAVTDGNLVLGIIRHWTNVKNQARANIEGTQIPIGLARRYGHEIFHKKLEAIGSGLVLASFKIYFAGQYVGDVDRVIAEADLPN